MYDRKQDHSYIEECSRSSLMPAYTIERRNWIAEEVERGYACGKSLNIIVEVHSASIITNVLLPMVLHIAHSFI